MADDHKHEKDNARGWLAEIHRMAQALRDSGDDDAKNEAARDAIHQSVLSVLVRDGWREVGKKSSAEEFEILLTTGGPALRIRGELDMGDEPKEYPSLEWQGWGTPWTPCDWLSPADREAIHLFASVFYFSE